MTKPYWGGLRVGWIRAPAPVIARLAALRVTVDTAGPVLDQLVALRLLERADGDPAGAPGPADRPARRPGRRAARPPAGLDDHRAGAAGSACGSSWTRPVSTALAQAALAHGVRLAPGPRFGVDGTLERYVRLPFTLRRAGPDRGGPADRARRRPTWTGPARRRGPTPALVA